MAFAGGDSSASREFAEQVIAAYANDARAKVHLAETYLKENRKLAIEELANALAQSRSGACYASYGCSTGEKGTLLTLSKY